MIFQIDFDLHFLAQIKEFRKKSTNLTASCLTPCRTLVDSLELFCLNRVFVGHRTECDTHSRDLPEASQILHALVSESLCAHASDQSKQPEQEIACANDLLSS